MCVWDARRKGCAEEGRNGTGHGGRVKEERVKEQGVKEERAGGWVRGSNQGEGKEEGRVQVEGSKVEGQRAKEGRGEATCASDLWIWRPRRAMFAQTPQCASLSTAQGDEEERARRMAKADGARRMGQDVIDPAFLKVRRMGQGGWGKGALWAVCSLITGSSPPLYRGSICDGCSSCAQAVCSFIMTLPSEV